MNRRSFLAAVVGSYALTVGRGPLARWLGAAEAPEPKAEPVPIEKRERKLWAVMVGGPARGEWIPVSPDAYGSPPLKLEVPFIPSPWVAGAWESFTVPTQLVTYELDQQSLGFVPERFLGQAGAGDAFALYRPVRNREFLLWAQSNEIDERASRKVFDARAVYALDA